MENTHLKNVDFDGLDIKVVNHLSESFVNHLNMTPKIAGNIKYLGSIEGQINLIHEHQINRLAKKLIDEGADRDIALNYAKKKTPKPNINISTNTYAHQWNLDNVNPDISGIAVGKKYGGNEKLFTSSVKKNVSEQWHPEKTDSIKAVMDHEFGHLIDQTYKISDDKTISNLYNSQSPHSMKNGLSEYACKSKEEFIAEAWAEYVNNPKPRPIAKKVGDIITKKINEG